MSKLPRMDNPANTTLREYARLMRIDRPVGTLLLLWPTWLRCGWRLRAPHPFI